MQQRLTGIAELEETWGGHMPTTDEERRAFEQQCQGKGIIRQALEVDGVQESADPELYGVLMQRVQQGEKAGESSVRQRHYHEQLVELRDTPDPFGARGVSTEMQRAKKGLAFEVGYATRLKEDRAAGIYQSREHERHEHAAAMQPQRRTAAQERLAETKQHLAASRSASQSRQQDQSQGIEL